MIYRDLCGENVSVLAFGTMRFPLNEDKTVNFEETERIVDYAYENGVNYFDTAYVYHGGESEKIIGRILKKYPRESFFLADKFPGFIDKEKINAEKIFEEQLVKCGVEYFDFYLFHSVSEGVIPVYEDEKYGIFEYLIKQKENGRIRHLGFSTHAGNEAFDKWVADYKDIWEFCQIQFNYLDATMQDALYKYNKLTKMGIPVLVMEPVRGGKLANLPEGAEKMLKRYGEGSPASYAFRYLQGFSNVSTILSGMSAWEQVEDNLKTFEKYNPLSKEETETVYAIAEEMKKAVPCTSCRYCCDGCPKNIEIPKMISLYNELSYINMKETVIKSLKEIKEGNAPTDCIACGECAKICPQKIDIPEIMRKLGEAE